MWYRYVHMYVYATIPHFYHCCAFYNSFLFHIINRNVTNKCNHILQKHASTQAVHHQLSSYS